MKLKEISYIHAEGYPAGEMKHGPIALIDEQMPVVAIAPHDAVFEKMLGNIQEVKARGGSVIALTTEGDDDARRSCSIRSTTSIVALPATPALLMPIVDGRAAAAARVPHRRAPRLRRRPAEESGEERDGRIAGSWQRQRQHHGSTRCDAHARRVCTDHAVISACCPTTLHMDFSSP